MRLLDTYSLKLAEFPAYRVPAKYAILSHCWEDGQEVTFQEMCKSEDHFTGKSGYQKIRNFCQLACNDGFGYAWVDTCCINKADNTELQGAIKSMYRWYQYAGKCYVYLNDVENINQLSQSRWFERGWTLQELLAPERLEFFSRHWRPIGEKRSLTRQLSTITGIPEQYLNPNSQDLVIRSSAARKISWVSHRKTTKPEDMAYCLVGLFGVSMPLIYGEGAEGAFLRLQKQIIQISRDTSIFAWTIPVLHRHANYGLLAPSVECFASSHEIDPVPGMSKPFSMKNKGIGITLGMREMGERYYAAYIYAASRRIEDHNSSGPLAIYLVHTDEEDLFYRVSFDSLPASIRRQATATGSEKASWKLSKIYVAQWNASGIPLPAV